MDETISAAEANRSFSRLLREVREGHSFVVTSHGRPVARLVPFTEGGEERLMARNALLGLLRDQPLLKAGRWKRDEIYDAR